MVRFSSRPIREFHSLHRRPRGRCLILNFAPLENAVARLRTSARLFEEQEQKAPKPLALDTRKQLDQILIQCDRALLRPEGLPRRPWYKHEIYAPGYYTGYDAKTIPGVREAIEERRWDDANAQIPIVAETLERWRTRSIGRPLFLMSSGAERFSGAFERLRVRR